MKNENHILMMNKIINDLGYTDIGDRDSKKKGHKNSPEIS